MEKLPQSVHVVGICGVATSALAIAFQKKGVLVRGSDKGFFPPVSQELEKNGIDFYAGFHVEKMLEKGEPEIVIIGTASGSDNPETKYAKDNHIPTFSFAEAIGKYFLRKNNIVCAGTWGKTSSSALLSYIFEYAKLNPTYMFGGISLSQASSGQLSDGDYAIFEGDEYKSSPTDKTAKFFYYKPNYLMLTAVSWDHADLYPTEKDYFSVFRQLVESIPSTNFIIACKDNVGVQKILGQFSHTVISYGKENSMADYEYSNVIGTKDGLCFQIKNKETIFKIKSPILGLYQAENITGCFAMAHSIGIDAKTIVKAIAEWKGLRRRMEIRLNTKIDDSEITIIDDIAHSPEKVSSLLATIRNIYQRKIVAIFEPNTGSRKREITSKYDHTFDQADMVIIPRLSKLKIASHSDKDELPLEGAELAEIISKTKENTIYCEEDKEVVRIIKNSCNENCIVVFMGSHGFRGIIEETIKALI